MHTSLEQWAWRQRECMAATQHPMQAACVKSSYSLAEGKQAIIA
jgi:hypothetical protein